MRLRAHITIDIDAADFISAADHQRRVEELLGVVRQSYAAANLDFRERRERSDARPMAQAKPCKPTGALNAYDAPAKQVDLASAA